MGDKTYKEQRKAFRKERRKEFMGARKSSGSALAGLLFLGIGTILLMNELGVKFPDWLITWQMIIIAFGLLVGAGNAFRDPAWIIITGVGTVLLLNEYWPAVPISKYWPVLIIAVGLIIIVVPRRHRHWREKWYKDREIHDKHDWEKWPPNTPGTPAVETPVTETPITETPATLRPVTETDQKKGDNWLEVVTIFGNVKKRVYSKNFLGGDIVSIFGGAEINLTQADINGNIIIELVQIFGGTKLIVPPHWQIRTSGTVAIFGGIEDKRAPQNNYDEDKVVILNGTTLFGGIEIKSY